MSWHQKLRDAEVLTWETTPSTVCYLLLKGEAVAELSHELMPAMLGTTDIGPLGKTHTTIYINELMLAQATARLAIHIYNLILPDKLTLTILGPWEYDITHILLPPHYECQIVGCKHGSSDLDTFDHLTPRIHQERGRGRACNLVTNLICPDKLMLNDDL
ncbi:hypothetical protein BYT27DRAFT_7262861 [Phlegmacium glaucopus]|nr:hypothetical protein BYT27DRAFT_7262861 [Phlegmacium glaucopus]